MTDYQYLLEFCTTERQREVISTIIECGGARAAARKLGVNYGTVSRCVTSLREKAAKMGCDPRAGFVRPVPAGFIVKGVSTLYGQDGKKLEWVKVSKEREDLLEELKIAIEALTDEARGLAEPVDVPKCKDSGLVLYPLGDPHVGMYAWAEETGADFDCDIAERLLCSAIASAVKSAPPTRTAIILNLGDFFHSDSMDNVTRRSGNSLDVDTRWPRVLEIGVNAIKQCIFSALEKHERVIVKNCIGNHDDHTSIALSMILRAYFEREPRASIDTSPSIFWRYRFGKVLIAATHGHTIKPNQLGEIMASEWPEDWGRSRYRYFHTGHIHTQNMMELRGCVWESHRTLAPRDAWHASHAYKAGRDIKWIHYHHEYGEIARATFSVDRILREL